MRDHPSRSRSALRYGIRLLLALTVGACEMTDFTSPALVEDDYLDDPSVARSLLRGVIGDYAQATAGPPGHGGVYMAGALLTDELVGAGTRPAHQGFSEGNVLDSWPEIDELWGEASRARWTAEDLAERLDRVIPKAEDEVEERNLLEHQVEAIIWAGFANRMLGDNFCEAVINSGPVEPHTSFSDRAESHFTRALQLAHERELADLVPVAHAGRAQVRMMQGDWDGALADAAEVENNLAFEQIHYGTASSGDPRERNYFAHLVFALAGTPSLEVTVWGTPFAEWGQVQGTDTGDPRVRYLPFIDSDTTSLDQRRPFYRQMKYTSRGSNIAIAKGTEMRLIEAEAALIGGDISTMTTKINEVRDHHGLEPLSTPSDIDEAWELLMKERGIELWLEGRRLPDMRRWAQVPGEVPFEVVREPGPGDHTTDTRRKVLDVSGELCLPIVPQERRTNPNI